jgi:hypothetical protein
MTNANKLKMAMMLTKTNQVKLAELTNQSQQNLSDKIRKDNFRISEFEQLVTAMGCMLKIQIILPNGDTI